MPPFTAPPLVSESRFDAPFLQEERAARDCLPARGTDVGHSPADPRQRLHRTWRRVRSDLLVSCRLYDDPPGDRRPLPHAVPPAPSRDPATAPSRTLDPPSHHRRPGRAGPAAHRAVHGGGKAPQLRAAARHGLLPAAPDDVPVPLTDGLVVLQHGHPSGQTQHLRLPEPRSENLPTPPLFDPHRIGGPRAEAWPLAHPTAQTRDPASPKIQGLLDDP